MTRSDEQEITDRVKSHRADGFVGFYSTAISSPLSQKLEGLKDEFEVKVFDPGDIEEALLGSSEGRKVAKRYFPNSYRVWESEHPSPANFLNRYEPLDCMMCGKDLLSPEMKYKAIVVFVRKRDGDYSVRQYVDCYWACKGGCDREMSRSYPGCSTSWQDISDILIPMNYIKWHIGIMNAMQGGSVEYNSEAFERMRDFTIKIAQLVVRNQTEDQERRLAALAELPIGI